MAYRPSNVQADPKSLPIFLEQEFRNVAQAMAQSEQMLMLQPQFVAPKRYSDGCICLADGASWNPGAGAGFYGYYGGSWKKLG